MTLTSRFLVLHAVRDTRRAARRRRRDLVRDLAGYNTPSQRLELAAILDRYPDSVTEELRDILGTAIVAPPRPLHWQAMRPGERQPHRRGGPEQPEQGCWAQAHL